MSQIAGTVNGVPLYGPIGPTQSGAALSGGSNLATGATINDWVSGLSTLLNSGTQLAGTAISDVKQLGAVSPTQVTGSTTASPATSSTLLTAGVIGGILLVGLLIYFAVKK